MAASSSLHRKFICLVSLSWLCLAPLAAQDFHFDHDISKPVLENYLSRAMTFSQLLQDDLNQPRDKRGEDPRDNIRFILNTHAKFLGRTLMMWGNEKDLPHLLKNAKPFAEAIHKADPDIILEAGEFEIITPDVETLTVPKSVLAEFGQPVVDRKFIYKNMLFPEGTAPHHDGTTAAVPDITQVESQMWFYFLAASYIDVGIEAIHFGQVGLIGKRDTDWKVYYDLMGRIREYAHQHARRHMVLCDAHEPPKLVGGIVKDGKLLFDFHVKPMRIVEVPGKPFQGVLQVGFEDSLYQRSKGGVTPSGWSCEHLPYLVELDNFGAKVKTPGKPSGEPFIWGWDEITWFALLPEQERNNWLQYAWNWLKKTDPEGHILMPAGRTLFPGPGIEAPRWFFGNTKSAACPDGFNTEETIKAIWAADRLAGPKAGL